MKVFEENPFKWTSIIEGLLLGHHLSKHSSTRYFPFKLLYNREAVLPIDLKYKLSSTENSDSDEPFDKDILHTELASSNIIREEVHRQAGENIGSIVGSVINLQHQMIFTSTLKYY